MKILRADSLFSKYIRQRDGHCVRCGSTQALQCSHYFGRTRWTVRFDPMNCDCLCYGCHRLWEKEDREAYRRFKVNQLGQDGFEDLCTMAQLTLKSLGETKTSMAAKVVEKFKVTP